MPQPDPVKPLQQFIARLQASLDDGRFVRLLLGRPHGGDPTLTKLMVRQVVLRDAPHLSLLWRHQTKDITKNLPLPGALDELAQLIDTGFHHAHLVTQDHDVQLAWVRKGSAGRWTLRVGKLGRKLSGKAAALADPPEATHLANATAADNTALQTHDQPKNHPLSLSTPFLAALGVTDAQARLVPAMARKWRQINKFVEILSHAVAQSPLAQRDPAQPVRVLDFGAGKGYLTFAVHHQLQQMGRVPDVLGVELRPELADLCNQAAAQLGLSGLHFGCGDVRSHAVTGDAPIDIMIALHACDTATDLAMHRGVQLGAAIILCSPCCHKELRPQMSAPPLLAPMLRHGIHMGEQAEMLTDSLRALLLQAAGYDTQVFEFISPEHTSKNKMVLAVRRAQPLPAAQAAHQRAQCLEQVADLMAHYGVRQQTLQGLMAAQPIA